MRLLADENIALETVRALRTAGHDVYAASETAVGTSDDALLKVATAAQRLLITFDHDFGELATRHGEAAPGGHFAVAIRAAECRGSQRVDCGLACALRH